MKILLDTHVLLWALKGANSNGDSFPDKISSILLNEDNEIYYSCINIFEIEIKRIAKPEIQLPSGEELVKFCKDVGFLHLPLRYEHTLQIKSLEKDKVAENHKDPFDWLLLSQAKFEKMTFITHDSILKHYLEDFIVSF